MNILKVIVVLISLVFSSQAMAKALLFEMTYPADEQVSGCEIHHVLYDSGVEQVSMLWVAESVCAGAVVLSNQVTFSQNTMKAWPVLLRKAAAWAVSKTLENELVLHHWGTDIYVKVLRDEDLLAEKHVYFTVQNVGFPTELQRPLRIDVLGSSWKALADRIAQQAF